MAIFLGAKTARVLLAFENYLEELTYTRFKINYEKKLI